MIQITNSGMVRYVNVLYYIYALWEVLDILFHIEIDVLERVFNDKVNNNSNVM
jgi:hypothetical protein